MLTPRHWSNVASLSYTFSESLPRGQLPFLIDHWSTRTVLDIDSHWDSMQTFYSYWVGIACPSKVFLQKFGSQYIPISQTSWSYWMYHCWSEDNSGPPDIATTVNEWVRSAFICLEPASPRLAMPRLRSASFKVAVITVCAPNLYAEPNAKNGFYNEFQNLVRSISRSDIFLITEDWNAHTGPADKYIYPFGLGEQRGNGDRFATFLDSNWLVVTNTRFQHPKGICWRGTHIVRDNCNKPLLLFKEVSGRKYIGLLPKTVHLVRAIEVSVGFQKGIKKQPKKHAYAALRYTQYGEYVIYLTDAEPTIVSSFVVRCGVLTISRLCQLNDRSVLQTWFSITRRFSFTCAHVTEKAIGTDKILSYFPKTVTIWRIRNFTYLCICVLFPPFLLSFVLLFISLPMEFTYLLPVNRIKRPSSLATVTGSLVYTALNSLQHPLRYNDTIPASYPVNMDSNSGPILWVSTGDVVVLLVIVWGTL